MYIYIMYIINICIYLYIYIHMLYIYINMVLTTERFFEVAIESLPEWDLNPRQLNSVRTL